MKKKDSLSRWEFEVGVFSSGQEAWQPYDDASNALIEDAFCMGKQILFLETGYLLNFDDMDQQNVYTQFKRSIRRYVMNEWEFQCRPGEWVPLPFSYELNVALASERLDVEGVPGSITAGRSSDSSTPRSSSSFTTELVFRRTSELDMGVAGGLSSSPPPSSSSSSPKAPRFRVLLHVGGPDDGDDFPHIVFSPDGTLSQLRVRETDSKKASVDFENSSDQHPLLGCKCSDEAKRAAVRAWNRCEHVRELLGAKVLVTHVHVCPPPRPPPNIDETSSISVSTPSRSTNNALLEDQHNNNEDANSCCPVCMEPFFSSTTISAADELSIEETEVEASSSSGRPARNKIRAAGKGLAPGFEFPLLRPVVQLPRYFSRICGHTFHADCLVRTLKQGPQRGTLDLMCPLCRTTHGAQCSPSEPQFQLVRRKVEDISSSV